MNHYLINLLATYSAASFTFEPEASAEAYEPSLGAPDMDELDSDGESKWNLLLSVEVCRHGEREPGHIYPFAAVPEENFAIPYNLTATGAESHYVNGMGLRTFFDKQNGGKGFLSANYDETEVYVQTSYKQRTIDSARA